MNYGRILAIIVGLLSSLYLLFIVVVHLSEFSIIDYCFLAVAIIIQLLVVRLCIKNQKFRRYTAYLQVILFLSLIAACIYAVSIPPRY